MGRTVGAKGKKSKATCKVVPSENVKQAKGKTSTPKKKGKKGKNESLAKIYKCPHCPNDPPYAGASGLWYHMKRHHGAVTRPYNSKKRREGRKNGKASQKTTKKKKKKKQPVVKKKKYVTKAAVSKISDDSDDSDYSDNETTHENQKKIKQINVGELASALNTNNRVKAVLEKAASFDPMLFLSEVAVLEDRVASSEDSGMTTVQAVTKESTDLNTPSPVRPVPQKMLSNYDDVLIAKETLQSTGTSNIVGVKRSLQVYNGEEEKKESPKEDWSGKSFAIRKKRRVDGILTPTKTEIMFLQGNSDIRDNENGESRSPVPTQQQNSNNSHQNSPQNSTSLFTVQRSPPVSAH